MKKIIYDFGANNGDNIPYYLSKSDLVIAVEANPELCNLIKNRFNKEIEDKKLIVENCILISKISSPTNKFYLHKERHLLSQFPKPEPDLLNKFNEVTIISKNVIEIIKKYGEPYYIKIDLENYDHIILKEIFINNIKPKYISAESTFIDIYCLMMILGEYKSFKLVNGDNVQFVYEKKKIETLNGKEEYSFPANSAGPFGNDIIGPWISPENFFHLLAHKGLGWKDIHCSSIDCAEKNESYLKYIDIDNKIEEKVILGLKSSSKKISKIKKIISNIFFKKKSNIK